MRTIKVGGWGQDWEKLLCCTNFLCLCHSVYPFGVKLAFSSSPCFMLLRCDLAFSCLPSCDWASVLMGICSQLTGRHWAGKRIKLRWLMFRTDTRILQGNKDCCAVQVAVLTVAKWKGFFSSETGRLWDRFHSGVILKTLKVGFMPPSLIVPWCNYDRSSVLSLELDFTHSDVWQPIKL